MTAFVYHGSFDARVLEAKEWQDGMENERRLKIIKLKQDRAKVLEGIKFLELYIFHGIATPQEIDEHSNLEDKLSKIETKLKKLGE